MAARGVARVQVRRPARAVFDGVPQLMRVTRRGSQELFAIPPAVSSHGFVGTRDLLGSHASWPRKFDPQLAPGPEAEEGVLVGVRAVLQDQGAHCLLPPPVLPTPAYCYCYHY